MTYLLGNNPRDLNLPKLCAAFTVIGNLNKPSQFKYSFAKKNQIISYENHLVGSRQANRP